jgi:hypothetical protein
MRALALASIAVLAISSTLAASAADAPDKTQTVQAPVPAKHKSAKTTGHVQATKVPDPNAGTDDQGKPQAAVTNGGQMATP